MASVRFFASGFFMVGCAPETVFLSRFWGFCLLAGIFTLLVITWLVNLKDTSVRRKYLVSAIGFAFAAGLAFPGWSMKSPQMSSLLKQIQSLRALTAMANQGALRNISQQKQESLTIDCRKLKTDSGIQSHTELKAAPDLSSCLRKLAQFQMLSTRNARGQKGMAQARSLLNSAEQTINKCLAQRRPMTNSEKRDVDEQIKAAEALVKGDSSPLTKSERDRLIRRLFNAL